MPDLRSLPAFSIQVNRKGTQLQFAANVWNGGNSPLVVDGFRRAGEDVMDAYQYFLDEDGNQIAYQQVGTMVWHPAPTHMHWHFTDFATYELLNEDMTHAVRSGKESFCLANTDAVDFTGEGAEWSAYEDDLGSVCGGYEVRSIREVLSAGWGDTYAQFRAGQSFPIKNLADGVYYVRVLANPDGTLVESDTTNNESLRKVRIYTNKQGERQREGRAGRPRRRGRRHLRPHDPLTSTWYDEAPGTVRCRGLRRCAAQQKGQPFFLLISSVAAGSTVCRSPTTPKSTSSKIGASSSLLTATMVFEVCMPARCWIAPEMPLAM